jgi:hypothetical protein
LIKKDKLTLEERDLLVKALINKKVVFIFD